MGGGGRFGRLHERGGGRVYHDGLEELFLTRVVLTDYSWKALSMSFIQKALGGQCKDNIS